MYFENIDWRYVMDIALATIVGALIAVAGSIIINHLGNVLNNYVNRKGYKIKQIENIAENLQKDRESDLRKESFLSSDMKIINESIANLSDFTSIMKTLNEENIILKSENQSLILENEQLKNQLSQQLKGRKTL